MAVTTLMFGLPTAGKTTYLAALWDALESGASVTKLGKLPDSTIYLSQIRDAWLNFSEIGRTPHAGVNETTLDLVTPKGPLTLAIPDLSGEHFRDAWEKRSWSTTIDQLVEAADGLLLFVHSSIERPVSLDLLQVLAGAAGGAQPAKEVPHTPWTPELTSTEVKLVDVLQLIRWRRGGGSPSPLAVVVSAWDLVQAEIKPSDWLRDELPLLSQYLDLNHDAYRCRAFGISAQGGSLDQAPRLRDISRPADRIIARDNDGPIDVSGPIIWLAGHGD